MKKLAITFTLAIATLLSVQAQDEEQKKVEGEGIEYIDINEIPEDVVKRFETGDYQDANINEAYILSGDALTTVVGQEAMEYYMNKLPPEKLYVLNLTKDEKPSAIIYYTEDGQIYATKDLEL
ncbi:hypothetical protein WJR50_12780 [Catalinimonas sp. 4WD22]|uniref:hypothetical protein n=1 Tax=Catalinimonas locisalis TaxID=3133978 RepID=UPI003100BB1A